MLRADFPHRIRGGSGLGGHGFPLRCQLGQTEIQYFRVASFGDKNIGRFDIAVDDAFPVGRVERIRNFDGRG